MMYFVGANINAQDKTGATALFKAVSSGHLNVVETLVELGANVDLPITKGITPLLGKSCDRHTVVSIRG